MIGLWLESFGSLLESILINLVQWLTTIVQWVWKVFNAHTVLIGILAISISTNLIFTSVNTSTWWSERKAGEYMARLGIGPNLILSKAVYMHDLDDVVNGDALAFDMSGNQWCVKTAERHRSEAG